MHGTVGQINYLDRSLPSSLYRNGRVFSRRREDGDTTHVEGIVLEKREATVRNARCLEGSQRRTLARSGFELLARPLERSDLDFLELVVFELHYPDRVGENYFSKYSPRHEWYYYPAMCQEEALLIKQWDSAGPLARSAGQRADADEAGAPCTFSFHTAFTDPATAPDAPERWSIEVRCIAVYE
jgi:hypothetical protein